MPTYVLTLGDPHGIGPEITLKTLSILQQAGMPAYQLKVVGDCQPLLSGPEGAWLQALPWVQWVQVGESGITPEGQIAYQAIEQAVSLIARHQADGMVTGPISKEALWRAGFPYPGHTEILEMLANRWWPVPEGASPYQAEMAFFYRRFRLILLTRHVPLAQVSQTLDAVQIERTLRTLLTHLRHQEQIHHPRIVIMGVNPHAGEIGGEEERQILIPVLEKLRAEGEAGWVGPVAADGLFRGFRAEAPAYDAYVSPYHDQGLIPIKLVGGWSTVNVTLGLPFVRTSVSHGTAPDIVGQNIASPDSLLAALDCLDQLVRRQSTNPSGSC